MLQRVAGVHIAEGVGQVGHAVVEGHAEGTVGVVALTVAHVLHGVVAADGEDVLIEIMYSRVEALAEHMTVVGAHSHSLGVDGSDDVVLDIAVVESELCHNSVGIGKGVLIVEVEIHVVALLRLEHGIALFIVAVAEELPLTGQPQCALIAQLHLQVAPGCPCAGGTEAEGLTVALLLLILSPRGLGDIDRTRHMGVVVFHKGSGVPLGVGNELIAQPRDVLDVDAAHEGCRGRHGAVGGVVGGVPVEVDISLVECKEMLVADAIGEVGHGRERLSRELSERGGPLALRRFGDPLSRPAVGAAERIDVVRRGIVVTG